MTVSTLLTMLAALTVAPEKECSDYNSKDYPYDWVVEDKIVDSYGGRVYAPYSNLILESTRKTDIEHIVARSEAHNSGLCKDSNANIREQFSNDLLNLTVATPTINRHRKRAKDASEWLPEYNKCWYVSRIIEVKTKYGLTVDSAERDALAKVLDSCSDNDLILLIFRSDVKSPSLEDLRQDAIDELLSKLRDASPDLIRLLTRLVEQSK